MKPSRRKSDVLHIALFACKTYVLTVPVIIWLSGVVADLAGWNPPSSFAQRVVANEQSQRHFLLFYGYVVPFFIFMTVALAKQCDPKMRRSALRFCVGTGLLLGVVLYAASLPRPKTRGMAQPGPSIEAAAGTTLSLPLEFLVCVSHGPAVHAFRWPLQA